MRFQIGFLSTLLFLLAIIPLAFSNAPITSKMTAAQAHDLAFKNDPAHRDLSQYGPKDPNYDLHQKMLATGQNERIFQQGNLQFKEMVEQYKGLGYIVHQVAKVLGTSKSLYAKTEVFYLKSGLISNAYFMELLNPNSVSQTVVYSFNCDSGGQCGLDDVNVSDEDNIYFFDKEGKEVPQQRYEPIRMTVQQAHDLAFKQVNAEKDFTSRPIHDPEYALHMSMIRTENYKITIPRGDLQVIEALEKVNSETQYQVKQTIYDPKIAQIRNERELDYYNFEGVLSEIFVEHYLNPKSDYPSVSYNYACKEFKKCLLDEVDVDLDIGNRYEFDGSGNLTRHHFEGNSYDANGKREE